MTNNSLVRAALSDCEDGSWKPKTDKHQTTKMNGKSNAYL